MFTYKKIINSDLLHLALIFTLLRLDLDSYLDGGLDDRLETHDVFLGTNLAYSPTLYHNLYHPFNEYVHPKSIDSALYDRYSIFAELNSLGRYDRFRPTSNDIFAYLVDQEEKESQNPPERSMPDSSGNPSESANTNNEEYNNSRNEAVTEMGSVSSPESLGSSHISVSSNSELSYEDMNLIEILWKQDIDLGITKDAFEGRTSLEINKSKQVEETVKKKKEPPTETQIQPPPFDPWEGVDYTIDGETGEHIILDPSANQCLNDADDCTFNDFDFQQIAEELRNVPLEEAIHFFNDEKSENNTHTHIEKDTAGFSSFQDLRYENFTTDINMTLYDANDDLLFNEFQELDSLLNKNVENNNNPENQVSDRYLTDTENCWQDFTPALTVPPHVHINPNDVLQQQSRSPDIIVPENNSIIPDISNVSTNFSDMFDSVLLQNATLAFSDPNSYQNTGRILVDNATSLFNALSNHTDPTMENSMNITYDQNLPELFGPDNSTNPDFLSNLLFDEDLQLMDVSLDKDGYNIPVNKLVEDHPDSSSDTFASSMSSENNFDSDCMNSISGSSFIQDDHIKTELSSSPSSSSSSSSFKSSINNSSVNCNPPIAQKKYKLFGKKTLNFHTQNGNVDFRNYDDENSVNNPKHFGLEIHNKSNYDAEVNHHSSMQRIQDNVEHQHDYDNSITTRNFAQHVNHNHTYNMPFETTDLKRKPITRDKNDFEDELSRDERRAQLLKIPISNEDIIHLPIDEFNERLSKYDLGEEQLSLIRDIRRRGKNKVAAQNCRKRKLGQIVDLQQELEILLEQKAMMQAEREKLLTYRCIVREKYNKLYDLVVRSTLSDPPPPRPPNFSRQFTINQRNRNMSIPSNSTSIDSDMDSSKGARSKRKIERK